MHRRIAGSRAATKFDSQIGAVAPPICQPAVHVFAASRRHCENVAVNQAARARPSLSAFICLVRFLTRPTNRPRHAACASNDESKPVRPL